MERVIKDGGRYVKGAFFGKLGFCTRWAVHHHHTGPEWIEVVETDLHLKNLPEVFEGTRIVQASDLHCSRTVSEKYLRGCIERINLLQPDIVVLTGDYITHDYNGRFREKVADLIGQIKSEFGVYACLGNHDYGVGGWLKRNDYIADEIVELLECKGVNVLRNNKFVIEIDGRKLWLVGLGDVWVDDCRPETAFRKIDDDGVVITLAHNPVSVEHLGNYESDVVLCGHTHGNWVDFIAPFGGSFINRRYYCSGMYEVNNKKLYVNRGLGRLGRAFMNTRPEITVFALC